MTAADRSMPESLAQSTRTKDEHGVRWATSRLEPDYEISDAGEVRRITSRGGAAIGKVMSQRLSTRGYPQVSLRGRSYNVHRLVADAFLGPIPANLVVNHKDGDKTNNDLTNLEIVTAAENTRHAVAMGLTGKHSGASLIADTILQMTREGFTHRRIASLLDMSKAAVTRAVTRARAEEAMRE